MLVPKYKRFILLTSYNNSGQAFHGEFHLKAIAINSDHGGCTAENMTVSELYHMQCEITWM